MGAAAQQYHRAPRGGKAAPGAGVLMLPPRDLQANPDEPPAGIGRAALRVLDMLFDLTRSYAEAFGARDAQRVSALLHDDVVLEDPQAGPVSGRDAVMALNRSIFESCGSMACRARTILVEGDRSVLEFELDLDGKLIRGVDILEWRDGRIAAIRAYVNA